MPLSTRFTQALAPVALTLLAIAASPATAQVPIEAIWVANEGDYKNAANWRDGVVPINNGTDTYHAIIRRGLGTATHSGSDSSVSALTLRSNASQLNATLRVDNSTFSVLDNALLELGKITAVNGGQFLANNLANTTLQSARLRSESGGLVDVSVAGASFSTATRFGSAFSADGANSRVVVRDLGAISAPDQGLSSFASQGGVVDLSSASSISTYSAFMDSQGAGSLLDLSGLNTLTGVRSDILDRDPRLRFEARDGGTIDLSGLQTTQDVEITAESGGSIALGADNIQTSALARTGGNIVITPTAADGSVFISSITADGTGSLVDMSAVRAFDQGSGFDIAARAGGVVDISGLDQLIGNRDALITLEDGSQLLQNLSTLNTRLDIAFTQGQLLDLSSIDNLTLVTSLNQSNPRGPSNQAHLRIGGNGFTNGSIGLRGENNQLTLAGNHLNIDSSLFINTRSEVDARAVQQITLGSGARATFVVAGSGILRLDNLVTLDTSASTAQTRLRLISSGNGRIDLGSYAGTIDNAYISAAGAFSAPNLSAITNSEVRIANKNSADLLADNLQDISGTKFVFLPRKESLTVASQLKDNYFSTSWDLTLLDDAAQGDLRLRVFVDGEIDASALTAVEGNLVVDDIDSGINNTIDLSGLADRNAIGGSVDIVLDAGTDLDISSLDALRGADRIEFQSNIAQINLDSLREVSGGALLKISSRRFRGRLPDPPPPPVNVADNFMLDGGRIHTAHDGSLVIGNETAVETDTLTVSNGATFAANGSIDGNLRLLGGGVLVMDINGAKDFDQLRVGEYDGVDATAFLDGTFQVNLDSLFAQTLEEGDLFTMISADSIVGSFSNYVGMRISDELSFQSLFGSQTFSLVVTRNGSSAALPPAPGPLPAPEPGSAMLMLLAAGALLKRRGASAH